MGETHPRHRWVKPEAENLVRGLELEHWMDEVREIPQKHVRIVHLRFHVIHKSCGIRNSEIGVVWKVIDFSFFCSASIKEMLVRQDMHTIVNQYLVTVYKVREREWAKVDANPMNSGDAERYAQ